MLDPEYRQQLQEELRIKRRLLHEREMQRARGGASVDPAVTIAAEDLQAEIATLEARLGIERPRLARQPIYTAPPPARDFAAEEERARTSARQSDITHQLELLRITRQRLSVLRGQVRRLGDHAPSHMLMELAEGRGRISEIKRALDQLGAAYDNLPGDE